MRFKHKKLEKLTEYRNSDETLMKRKTTVQSWLSDYEMDFEKNCVFIDEAGFNLHISRTRGWSKVSEPAKTVVTKNKGTTVTILGAISSQGAIDISMRKPVIVTGIKKRKADGKIVATTAKIGTRNEHFLSYLGNVMDVLDKNELKGCYIVMDNAPIHKIVAVREFIEERGYKCAYLPPYSPFLNPIEEFWSKVKCGVKRQPFDGSDILTPQIIGVCSQVTLTDRKGWIRHSVSFFDRCLSLEKNL